MPVTAIESGTNQLRQVLRLVLIVLVLANALAVGLRTVSDSDTGWHLATGRYVWQHRLIPGTDVLSYTAPGKPWVYPPFGAVLLYLIYSDAGYAGLSWFSALACLGIAAYLIRSGDTACSVLTLMALPSIAYRTAPRADLFSTVFFAVFLGELWAFQRGTRRNLWLLPSLMLLWVNFHPGFIAGLAVVGAYLLLEGFEFVFPRRREPAIERLRASSPWLIATCLATLINPWGFRIFPAALNLSGFWGSPTGALNSSVYIQEFLGLRISWLTFLRLFDVRHVENGNSWLLVISFLLFLLALWYRELGAALIVAVALYACLLHVRFLGMFAITIVTVGSTLIAQALHAGESRTESHSRVKPLWHPPALLASVFAIAVCMVACVHVADYASNHSYVVYAAPFRFGAGESSSFPEGAAAFVERERLPGNIFEEFALGGFTAFRLGPAYPDFIDGRFDHLDPAVFREEQNLMRSGPSSSVWEAAVNHWKINVLFVSTAGARAFTGLDVNAFCSDPGWQPIYMDEVSLLFLRNTTDNRPWLDRLSVSCGSHQLKPPQSDSHIAQYDFHMNAAGLLYALHRDGEAADETRRASTLFPNDPNSYFLLARILHRQQDLANAEEEYRRGLSLNDDDGAWFELGRILIEEHRYPEAEQALKHAIRLSLQPLVPYLALARLELMMGQPSKAMDALQSAEDNSPYRRGGEAAAPELYADIAEGRAAAYRMQGDLSRAVEQERRAVSLTPSNPVRWNRLAELFQSSGRWQEALEARSKARALSAAEGEK